ncbi:MAG: cytochrome c [Proteobacteria bacterium]|uniref:SorB family sulfite dehydrogenase c-type cytochrome subunit n=1 Tax=Rudaea sp. TaxID=2136325 RepID=UPI00321FFB1F|nr:cytochrome c [Pseudomonadota bacterium]
MPTPCRCLIAVAGLAAAVLAAAAPLKIDLPKESAPSYKPGPNLPLVNARCLVCHSADYAAMQPPNWPRKTWEAEVVKMKKVYGAPIADDEIATLADYFAKTYGNETAATAKP